MKELILISLCVLISLYSKSETLLVNKNSEHNAFYESIKFIECEPNTISITDILESDSLLESFQTVPYGVNFPYPSSAYWVYFDIVNTDTVPTEQILSINNPNLNELFLYKCKGKIIIDSTITGERLNFHDREIQHINFLFSLKIPAQDTIRIFAYLHNHTDEIFLPITLSPANTFIENDASVSHSRVLKAGMLLFVIIGMLFLSLITRSKLAIYFLFYVASISIYLLNVWGINQQYALGNGEFLSINLAPICITLTILFAQLFNRLFLDSRNNKNQIAEKLLITMLWASIVTLATFLLPISLIVIQQGAVIVLAAIASFVTPICGIVSYKHSPRASIYIFLSSFPITVTVGLYILRFYGMVKSDTLLFGFDTAFVIELIILMFGIIDQLRHTLVASVKELSLSSVKLKEQKRELEQSNEVLKQAIAEKEAMQKKLLQVHKLETIGKLAGGIAHDFNNLLTPIIGYTEMSLDAVQDDEELHADLSIVLKSSKRAKELVNQILTFSKHFKEQVQHVSLISIIDEVASLLKSVIPSIVVIKHRYDEDDDPYILADPTQIHQILMNICTNAYHAIGENQGTITIEHIIREFDEDQIKASKLHIQAGTYVQISITDTGIGMNSETLGKVFDPFFTTKDSGKGTGLGLSVVHGIVKKLNGCIKVDSQVNVGTTFNVFLPLSQGIEEKQNTIEKVQHSGSGKRVIIIDDEAGVLSMLEKLLSRNGYETIAFNNGIDAIKHFTANKENISLVITDQTMPIMKGSELSQKIKEINHLTPIVLITGYSETVTNNNYHQFGIDKLILKPVSAAGLLNAVGNLTSK